MFTGIVEEVGVLRALCEGSITIAARKVLEGTRLGDSIAVNGVCLTVTRLLRDGFTADVMGETLRRSNLGTLRPGQPVNLERAMAADGRFGGHIVSGHVDNMGEIVQTQEEGFAHWITVSAPGDILELVVEKGSIATDGVSLTVARRTETTFSVSLIPTTQSETTLLEKRVGDRVNLESDIVGKYVRQLLGSTQHRQEDAPASSRLSEAFLLEHGF